jgi:hypothetical protein
MTVSLLHFNMAEGKSDELTLEAVIGFAGARYRAMLCCGVRLGRSISRSGACVVSMSYDRWFSCVVCVSELCGGMRLSLLATLRFAGTVKNGFILHPDDTHVLYPLGTTVVIKHLKNGTQRFLQKGGHDRDVSCMALSPTGKYLASGQIAQSAFQVRRSLRRLQSILDLRRVDCADVRNVI